MLSASGHRAAFFPRLTLVNRLQVVIGACAVLSLVAAIVALIVGFNLGKRHALSQQNQERTAFQNRGAITHNVVESMIASLDGTDGEDCRDEFEAQEGTIAEIRNALANRPMCGPSGVLDSVAGPDDMESLCMNSHVTTDPVFTAVLAATPGSYRPRNQRHRNSGNATGSHEETFSMPLPPEVSSALMPNHAHVHTAREHIHRRPRNLGNDTSVGNADNGHNALTSRF